MKKMMTIVAVGMCVLLLFTGVCQAANMQGGPEYSIAQADTMAPAIGLVPDTATPVDQSGRTAGVLGSGVVLFLTVGAAMGFADVAHRGIPGPQDAGMVLQAEVTKTQDFDGAGLDMGEGFDPGGIGKLVAGVVTVVGDPDLANTDETYAFHLEESADNVTFADCGLPLAVTAEGVYVVKGILTKRYVRLVLDVDGTSPSIKYSASLNVNV